MMKIISVLNQKGGVGKSSICFNLACCFGSNLKVALVDSDAQGSISNMAKMVKPSIDVLSVEALNDISQYSYDVVIIDTPPYITNKLDNILSMSDFALIPLKASYYDIIAVKPTVAILSQQKAIKPHLRAGFVLNMVKPRTSINSEIRGMLEDFGFPTFQSSLSERVSYTRSPLSDRGIFGTDDNKAKTEVIELAKELLVYMGL